MKCIGLDQVHAPDTHIESVTFLPVQSQLETDHEWLITARWRFALTSQHNRIVCGKEVDVSHRPASAVLVIGVTSQDNGQRIILTSLAGH